MFVESLPLYGVTYYQNHACVKWLKGNVCFSFTRKGNGMSCHFATNNGAVSKIREAFSDFIVWIFYHYDWCEMLFAFSDKPSINRLLRRLGWNEYHIYDDNRNLFMRTQKWVE